MAGGSTKYLSGGIDRSQFSRHCSQITSYLVSVTEEGDLIKHFLCSGTVLATERKVDISTSYNRNSFSKAIDHPRTTLAWSNSWHPWPRSRGRAGRSHDHTPWIMKVLLPLMTWLLHIYMLNCSVVFTHLRSHEKTRKIILGLHDIPSEFMIALITMVLFCELSIFFFSEVWWTELGLEQFTKFAVISVQNPHRF